MIRLASTSNCSTSRSAVRSSAWAIIAAATPSEDELRYSVGTFGGEYRPADREPAKSEDNHVLGGIALRHESDPLVQRAGHIGYGIRPSARRRGLATWAVARIVEEARALGVVLRSWRDRRRRLPRTYPGEDLRTAQAVETHLRSCEPPDPQEDPPATANKRTTNTSKPSGRIGWAPNIDFGACKVGR